ncbi:arsenate-mycothiol transferase ArsC [Promicromonospora sukumoe]|uniref:arsenate-mycothiol transferase ArsC n=1 Tax=Promicromonospora sukumoe TaxID=88382 RepID=UPI0003A7C4A8|nr:low molecular weight phosphatase family protein [Promicromonospora sukumoe]
MTPDELRSAQRLTMANPERLRLLARLLTHPAGRSTAAGLVPDGAAGEPADLVAQALAVADVEQDLEALVSVGLVAVVGPEASDAALYRVSSRGIARYGTAALAAPRFLGEPALDVHDHEALLDRLVDTLAATFAANAGAGTVDRLVRECYAALVKQVRTSAQLPALTAWLATDRLAAMTEVTHGSPRDVLFVCVHNTGRSQIAAAVTRRLAGDRIRVRTAGTRPVSEPDQMTETVLARRGLDGLIEFPRELTDDIVRSSGVIVTMGCGDTCPVFPGRRYLDWPLDDPAGRPIEEVERIVDDVTARVQALIAEIDAADDPARTALPELPAGSAVPSLPAGAGGPVAAVGTVAAAGHQRGWLPRLTRPWTAVTTALGGRGQRKAR